MAKMTDYLKNIFFLLLFLQITPPLIRSVMKQYSKILEPRTQVGFLQINGILYNATYYIRQLKRYFKNQDIKAILLKIECPGGAAGTAEAIAHEIIQLKKEYPKPIICYSENVIASGGYYVGAATDRIITSPSTLTGSIGVTIPYQFKLDQFIEQFKIKYKAIKAGEFKDATDPFVASTPEQTQMLQELATDSYENFTQFVAKQRQKLSLDKKAEWANGKLVTGSKALKLGLIDQIGSQFVVIEEIKKRGIIEGKIEWVKPQPEGGWFQLFGDKQTESNELSSSIVQGLLHQICTFFERRYASA